MNVSDALNSRTSVRAFLEKPVPGEVVKDILLGASRSPSGGNLQPWHVWALGGQELARFKALMAERIKISPMGEQPEYNIYPPELKEPYRSRRFKNGERSLSHHRDSARGQSCASQSAREELHFFRCACRPVFRHRSPDGAWAMGRSRHVHAIHYVARFGEGIEYLSARGLGAVAQDRRGIHRVALPSDALLRHGSRLHGSRASDQPTARRSC